MDAEQMAREFAAMNKAYERNHALLAEMRDERKLIRQDKEEIKAIVSQVKQAFDEHADELINARLSAILPVVTGYADRTIGEIQNLFDQWEKMILDLDSKRVAAMTDRISAAVILKMRDILKMRVG